MRLLSLHTLTALDAAPAELARIAGQLDVGLICLFTHVPPAAAAIYRGVAPADVPAVATALAEANVRLCNLEVFPLDGEDLGHLDAGLDTGARLGATRATAHLHDTDGEAHAIDRFGAFAEQAASHGITAGLEFNNFTAVRDIATAERIVRAAGRGSLVLDLLHLARGGGTPADAARAADLVGYVQLSDGPLALSPDRRWREAVGERQLPGEGELPLVDSIRTQNASAVFDIEVPQAAARKAGVSAAERCRRAVTAARRLMQTVDLPQ